MSPGLLSYRGKLPRPSSSDRTLVHEDVTFRVGVGSQQVRGPRLEGDEASVSRVSAPSVPCPIERGDRDWERCLSRASHRRTCSSC
jgi:hypothetical protein